MNSYIAFIIALMVAITSLTTLPRILWPEWQFLSPFSFVLIFIVLPVFSGNVALFLCSEKKRTFVPSLTIRYISLAIAMFGYYQIEKQAWNPTSNPEYDGLVDVTFMSIFGAQCFVLLVSEPILRRLLRKRAIEGTQNT